MARLVAVAANPLLRAGIRNLTVIKWQEGSVTRTEERGAAQIGKDEGAEARENPAPHVPSIVISGTSAVVTDRRVATILTSEQISGINAEVGHPMRNPGVHWYEGLFLQPHHLQAADRHWAEVIHTSQQWGNPYNYGLHDFEFSKDALANNQFEVSRLEARMRDGTLVRVDASQELDRLGLKDAVSDVGKAMANLEEAFEQEAVVRVYVGVPKLNLARANVAAGEAPVPRRYRQTNLVLADQSTGGNEQEVRLLELNVRLLLSTQDLSGYEVLPIAQVRRAGAGESRPRLDEDYVPPVLSIDAWPRLGRDIVRGIYDMIGEQIDVFSQQVTGRGIGLESRDQGDSERILMLSRLNEAQGTLGVLAFAQGFHPLTAYMVLCNIVGKLSIFGEARRLEELPPYDHDDLARIFSVVKERIARLLNSVQAYEYEQRYFVGVGLGMQVSLEPKWFNSDWEWYIGVHMGDLTQQECRELLSPGQLDWKFGSSRQVEVLFRQRAEGLHLIPLDRPIRALPVRPDWMYYEVPRRDIPAWRDVQETQTLAMRLKDSLIVNQDRLQGERRLVVSNRGKHAELEFALCAVPRNV